MSRKLAPPFCTYPHKFLSIIFGRALHFSRGMAARVVGALCWSFHGKSGRGIGNAVVLAEFGSKSNAFVGERRRAFCCVCVRTMFRYCIYDDARICFIFCFLFLRLSSFISLFWTWLFIFVHYHFVSHDQKTRPRSTLCIYLLNASITLIERISNREHENPRAPWRPSSRTNRRRRSYSFA